MASSEWVLGVQIQHFENVYGSEIINGQFCCCDDGSSDNDVSICKENITDQQMCKDSDNPCDNYFSGICQRLFVQQHMQLYPNLPTQR